MLALSGSASSIFCGSEITTADIDSMLPFYLFFMRSLVLCLANKLSILLMLPVTPLIDEKAELSLYSVMVSVAPSSSCLELSVSLQTTDVGNLF